MYRSAGVRFIIVGLLVLLMFIPMFFVGAIIDERASFNRSTIGSVSEEWGGAQTISGPQLIIPVEAPVTRKEQREITDPETGRVETETYEVTEIRRVQPVYLLPEDFDVTVDASIQERQRGIFRVPVYTADTDIAFSFRVEDAEGQLGAEDTALWDSAFVRLSVSSNRAIRGAATMRIDGADVPLEPATDGGPVGGIVAATGDPRGLEDYRLTLVLNGAQQLDLTPSGRTSRVEISSDWPDPSFTGAFLPDGSEISETGFTASWTIPHLARTLPQAARESFDATARREFGFGVRFFQPNDFYQKAYRAARYAILFIALTFLTVLLIERTDGRPTHPVQYIFIGLAQSLFVLLMVSYAEQIGFGPAYALSAAATILLLTLFGWVALRQNIRALVLGGMLMVLYAVLYLILESTDYALLAGSTLAFLALAVTMWVTRNEDWYGPAGEKRPGWGLFRGVAKPPADGGAGGPVADRPADQQ